MRVVDVGRDLFGAHHPLALFGELLLLAGDRRQFGQLLHGRAEIVGLAGGGLDAGAVPVEFAFGLAPVVEGARDGHRLERQAAILVEEQPVRLGVDQRAVVVLAMDLDQRRAHLLHQPDARRPVVDEDARSPVGALDTAQDQVAVVVEAVVGEEAPGRMGGRQVEDGRHLALFRAVPHQPAVAAPAERERQGVEQDRLAGAGLAGEHGQTVVQREVEPVDEDDIADRKVNKHA